jgi:hypothetical protein
MTAMHHFSVKADPKTGEWLPQTAKYLGEIDSAEHIAKKDTDAEHYDVHDGGCLSEQFWAVADGVKPVTANVAITVIWL